MNQSHLGHLCARKLHNLFICKARRFRNERSWDILFINHSSKFTAGEPPIGGRRKSLGGGGQPPSRFIRCSYLLHLHKSPHFFWMSNISDTEAYKWQNRSSNPIQFSPKQWPKLPRISEAAGRQEKSPHSQFYLHKSNTTYPCTPAPSRFSLMTGQNFWAMPRIPFRNTKWSTRTLYLKSTDTIGDTNQNNWLCMWKLVLLLWQQVVSGMEVPDGRDRRWEHGQFQDNMHTFQL